MKKFYVVGFNDASWIHTGHEKIKGFPYFRFRDAQRTMTLKEAKTLQRHFRAVCRNKKFKFCPIIFEIKKID